MAKRKIAEYNRGFKGVWIPKEVWLDENLTIQEIVFLVEIDSLDRENGCYASNQHFSDFFGLSKSRSSEIIKSLESKGYVHINYVRDGKEIKKRVIRVRADLHRGYSENRRGVFEKPKGSNTYLSNTKDNNIKEDSLTLSLYNQSELRGRTSERVADVILHYVNEYRLRKGKEHPRLKMEQAERVIRCLEEIDETYEMTFVEWRDVIDYYFDSESGDGNINRFASGDAQRGTLKRLLTMERM